MSTLLLKSKHDYYIKFFERNLNDIKTVHSLNNGDTKINMYDIAKGKNTL